jgi:hypothetical protein
MDEDSIATDDELRLWDLEDILNETFDAIRILNDRVRDCNLTKEEKDRVLATIHNIGECREALQDSYFELDKQINGMTPKLPSRFKNND